ncbi:HEPN domain-containing protein [bacterium]|nr:HEPN domain-containing protein [bacterium]
MSGDERILRVARGWVEKAENDLKNAAHTLKLGEDCPTDTVCFHAQQCVEKYLKALLVLAGVPFPRTHDISELLALSPPSVPVQLSLDEQRRLTLYATTTRYPGDEEPVTLEEARRAVAAARRVKKALRAIMPREVLWKKRP